MSFLTLSPDNARYNNKRDDLRINVSSGVFTLRDGTSGGIPVADTSFGIPSTLVSQTVRPSGLEGWSLQRFMNEFPQYSRIGFDKASVGAQLLTPFSMIYDEIADEIVRAKSKLTPMFYPTYEQGVIYEYDFNTASDLHNTPGVSGRLGDQWFNLPITEDSEQFWLSPPTRFETTTAEVFDFEVLGWTSIAHSGLNTLISTNTDIPLHNKLVLEISGALNFNYAITDDVPAFLAEAEIKGRWANDSLRADAPIRREKILIDRNGPFFTRHIYQSVESLDIVGLANGVQVKLKSFDFVPTWRVDDIMKYQHPVRNDITQFVVWHNIDEHTPFSHIIQTELAVPLSTSGNAYLARTFIQTDTIEDQDIEFDTIDLWALNDTTGVALSGILDIIQVPSTRYILALDQESTVHVFDTFIPALNLGGRAPVRPSPIYLESSWPTGSNGNTQTAGSYQLTIDPHYAAGQSAVFLDRWQWRLTKGNADYVITESGTLTAFDEKGGWRQHSSGTISPIEITVDDAVQYTVELRTVDQYGERYTTTTAHRKISKNAITSCPLNGLGGNPIGIDFDAYGRPWVQTSISGAVRLVMRNDIGFWNTDDKILLTREPYDEVRKNA